MDERTMTEEKNENGTMNSYDAVHCFQIQVIAMLVMVT